MPSMRYRDVLASVSEQGEGALCLAQLVERSQVERLDQKKHSSEVELTSELAP